MQIAILGAIAAVVALASLAAAGTIVVNSADDLDDGSCDPTHCSLREAVRTANATSAKDTIRFDIPGPIPHVIQAGSGLPPITGPLEIDGFSQPGAGMEWEAPRAVYLDGRFARDRPTGLTIRSSDVSIRGLGVGNWTVGILIDEGRHDHIDLSGNFIGTTADGTDFAPNRRAGIEIRGREPMSEIQIGLPVPGGGNLISGNGQPFRGAGSGVHAWGGPSFELSDLTLQNNRVGTDPTGMVRLQNGNRGIVIETGGTHRIGGPGPLEGNVISGNGREGLSLWAGTNVVEGNSIGVGLNGDPLGNGRTGLLLGSGRAMIGGLEPAAGNTIAYNGGGGVVLNLAEATIVGNSIHTNLAVGIRIGGEGITFNDPFEEFRNGQNWPELHAAGSNVVEGFLHSTPNQPFWLDFYWSSECDPIGHGEGAHYLGRLRVHTDERGNVSYRRELPSPAPPGAVLTATATREAAEPAAIEETSHFSNCVVVGPAAPIPELSTIVLTLVGVAFVGVAASRRG